MPFIPLLNFILKGFLKIKWVAPRTTGSILGLLVLNPNIAETIWIKKFEKMKPSPALYIYTDMVNEYVFDITLKKSLQSFSNRWYIGRAWVTRHSYWVTFQAISKMNLTCSMIFSQVLYENRCKNELILIRSANLHSKIN